MRISPDDVRHVARLAALEVPEEELPRLVAELDAIVAYVARLAGAVGPAPAEPFLPGPDRAPLRPDVVDPAPLARPPAAFAPEFQDGFFTVPRLPAMEGD